MALNTQYLKKNWDTKLSLSKQSFPWIFCFPLPNYLQWLAYIYLIVLLDILRTTLLKDLCTWKKIQQRLSPHKLKLLSKVYL